MPRLHEIETGTHWLTGLGPAGRRVLVRCVSMMDRLQFANAAGRILADATTSRELLGGRVSEAALSGRKLRPPETRLFETVRGRRPRRG